MKVQKMNRNLHIQLKIALSALDSSISAFARSLKKPGGDKIGISHSAVIRAAKGTEPTPWIVKAIEDVIEEAKEKHPEVYQGLTQN